jgi:hypothetical protein
MMRAWKRCSAGLIASTTLVLSACASAPRPAPMDVWSGLPTSPAELAAPLPVPSAPDLAPVAGVGLCLSPAALPAQEAYTLAVEHNSALAVDAVTQANRMAELYGQCRGLGQTTEYQRNWYQGELHSLQDATDRERRQHALEIMIYRVLPLILIPFL